MPRAEPAPLRKAEAREGGALLAGPEQEDSAPQQAGLPALHGPRRSARWTLRLSILFWAAALAWAALAEVDEVVVAEGRVIPSGQVRQVQNMEGGIIAEILVREGDLVAQGQPLLRMDRVRFSASAGEGEAKLRALAARIVRLEAEAGGRLFLAPAPERLDARLLAQERALFAARREALEAGLAVLRQDEAQRRQELTEKRARAAQLATSQALLSRELDMVRPLVKQGYVSQLQLVRLDRQASDLAGELVAAQLALPRLEAALREALGKLRELASRFQAEAGRELAEARAERSALAAAHAEQEDRLRRTEVRSPIAGVVKQLKVHTVGGVTQPGMDLMEIVPRDEALLVEAKVKPADIAYLHAGQEATIRLSAYDFSIYGGFRGTLLHVSADTLAPDKPGEPPAPYYLARLRTQGNTPAAGGKPLAILPGMVATVDIRTGRRTVLHYLLKPLIKTRDTMLRER